MKAASSRPSNPLFTAFITANMRLGAFSFLRMFRT